MFMYHVLEMWKGIMMKESQYEELLNIKTDGEELWSEKIKHNHPYQATSYDALEKLFERYINPIKVKKYIIIKGNEIGKYWNIDEYAEDNKLFINEKDKHYVLSKKERENVYGKY